MTPSVQPSRFSSSSSFQAPAFWTLRSSPSSEHYEGPWFSAPATWPPLRAALGFLLLSLSYVCPVRLYSPLGQEQIVPVLHRPAFAWINAAAPYVFSNADDLDFLNALPCGQLCRELSELGEGSTYRNVASPAILLPEPHFIHDHHSSLPLLLRFRVSVCPLLIHTDASGLHSFHTLGSFASDAK